jgi:transposase
MKPQGKMLSKRRHTEAKEEIFSEGPVSMNKTALKRCFSRFPGATVIMEAGTHSAWVSEFLTPLVDEVVVANPHEVARKFLSKTKKTDKSDARTLAQLGLGSRSFLAPIQHRSRASQLDLTLIRSREALLKARTELINHVRSVVKVFGERLPSCTPGAFGKRARLELERLPEFDDALLPLLENISRITEQIKEYDKKVERLCIEKYPETKRLMQIPGVGFLTALAYVLTLEEPKRFPKSRNVGAFLGMVPRQRQSGEASPQLRITKAGNEHLRRLLVMSAHYILGHFGTDSALRRHGERIVATGGKAAKKRAVIAVARKLSVVLHRLWTTGEQYEPFPHSSQKRKAS